MYDRNIILLYISHFSLHKHNFTFIIMKYANSQITLLRIDKFICNI